MHVVYVLQKVDYGQCAHWQVVNKPGGCWPTNVS